MTREERETLPPERETKRVPVQAIRVSVMDGSDAGQSIIVFPDMRVHVGREDLSDLRVGDRTVSSRHLAIDRVGERFRITDLDSANGTCLNGVPIGEAYIAAGDVISCGSVKLAVIAEPLDEEPPRSGVAFEAPRSGIVPFGKASDGRAPPDIKDLLAEWQAWAHVFSKRHRRAALHLERRHYWLGIPSTVMGTVVGTTIFGTLEEAAASWPLKTALAVVSMTAACLVALQTFFRYLERAGQHNLAHAEYEDIARSIELLAVDMKERAEWVKCLEGLGQRLDAIKGKAPIPPDAEDLEQEVEELKDRVRTRLSASVQAHARSTDTGSQPNIRRRAFSAAPTKFLHGPLDSARLYAEKERARRDRQKHHGLWAGINFAAQLRAFEAEDD